MKKFFCFVACVALAAGFSSCNDNDATFFTAGAGGVGLQFEGGSFIPVMSFAAYNGEFDQTETQVLHGGVPISRTYLDSNYILVNQSFGSIDDMSGTYVCNAVSATGETSASDIRLTFDKEMGDIDYENFSYTGSQLKMTVTTPVENATRYSFFLRPIINNSPTNVWINCGWFEGVTAGSSENQEVAISFNPSSEWFGSNVESVMVYPAAVRKTTTTDMLIRVGEGGKTLLRTGTSFEEDKSTPLE